jgi:hypothetical protein
MLREIYMSVEKEVDDVGAPRTINTSPFYV